LAWAFPGGAIEDGEDERAAVVREMREELGVTVRPIRRIWTWHREHPPLLLHCWTAEMLDADVRPNPAEVADVRWLSDVEIRTLPDLLPSCIALLDVLAG
jgi:8-oxo-dGTP pyrophosphatase MutT (NUDIX family)